MSVRMRIGGGRGKTKTFKSKAGFKRYEAYKHMHGLVTNKSGHSGDRLIKPRPKRRK